MAAKVVKKHKNTNSEVAILGWDAKNAGFKSRIYLEKDSFYIVNVAKRIKSVELCY